MESVQLPTNWKAPTTKLRPLKKRTEWKPPSRKNKYKRVPIGHARRWCDNCKRCIATGKEQTGMTCRCLP